MKNIKTTILNKVAKVGMNSAVKSCGVASRLGCYEPKMPKEIKKFVK